MYAGRGWVVWHQGPIRRVHVFKMDPGAHQQEQGANKDFGAVCRVLSQPLQP